MKPDRSWFAHPGDAAGGKLRALQPGSGRIGGLIAPFGVVNTGEGQVAFSATNLRIENAHQALYTLPDGSTVPVTHVAAGPAHWAQERAKPEYRVATGHLHKVRRGVWMSGMVAPEAIKKYGSVEQAEQIVNINPFSIEGHQVSAGLFELQGGFMDGDVLPVAVAVTEPGLAIPFGIAAADGGVVGGTLVAAGVAEDVTQVIVDAVTPLVDPAVDPVTVAETVTVEVMPELASLTVDALTRIVADAVAMVFDAREDEQVAAAARARLRALKVSRPTGRG